MIRYQITPDELKRRIAAHTSSRRKPWFQEAGELLANLPVSPRSSDFKAIWSEIKSVYIDLQHSKCAYCEQRLEGTITQDIEHFRPKSRVKTWNVPAALAGVVSATGRPGHSSSGPGYFYLAYHILNLAMSCKNCNTVLKKSLFPTAKTRDHGALQPPDPHVEEHYLVYPISNIDDDPENLLEFEGLAPIAFGTGFDRQRALVCIELFHLDDPDKRKELIKDRAETIELLYHNLRAIAENSDPALVRVACCNRDRMLLDSQPHANCTRSFKRLFDTNRAAADDIFHDVSILLNTMSR